MCVTVLPVCMACLWRSAEGVRAPEARVTVNCEPPYGYWNLKLDPNNSKFS